MNEQTRNQSELLCDAELEKLRKEALSAIMKLPEEKQIEMWNIIRWIYNQKQKQNGG